MDNTMLMAFDLEGLGTHPKMVIAVGATIISKQTRKRIAQGLWVYINPEFSSIAQLLAKGQEGVDYDAHCVTKFYQEKHPTLYASLVEKVNTTSQHDMMQQFLEFWQKWELYAKEHWFKFQPVSDNLLYDGHVVQTWIESDFPQYKPLPHHLNSTFNAHDGPHHVYGSILDCKAFEDGMDAFTHSTPLYSELKYLPPLLDEMGRKVHYKYDHVPSHDSHCIVNKLAHYYDISARWRPFYY